MKKLLAFIACVALTSCGFQPMYGTHSSAAHINEETGQAFSQIEIGMIADREGQFLRNELIDRLNSSGTPQNAKYVLGFSPLVVNKRELDLTKSSEATRSQIIATTDLKLSLKDTNEVVLSRPLKSISSYNILPSEFATNVTENAARESALKELARQAELQLSLYFNRTPALTPEEKLTNDIIKQTDDAATPENDPLNETPVNETPSQTDRRVP